MGNVYYRSDRNDMLKYVPENCSTILEIGCGEGNFAKLCKEKTGAYVIGIESNRNAGIIARNKIDEVYIGDANEEIHNLKDNSIDLIIFNDVLEHISYPDKLIKLISPKMKKDSYIIASIPNLRFISNLKHILWHKDFSYDKNGGIRDYTHLRFFTKRSILAFFKELNIDIIIIDGINPFPRKKISQKIFVLLLKILGQYDTTFLQFAVQGKMNKNHAIT